MRGSVRRRGAGWSVTYDEPARDGVRRQRSKGGFPTRRAAEAFLAEVLTSVGAGTYTTPSSLTFGDFLEREWLPSAGARLRPLSRKRYASIVRHHLVPGLGAIKLQALTPGQINSFYRRLEASGLSVATCRLVHAVTSHALKDATRWRLVARNAAAAADPPAVPRSRAVAWMPSEISAFLSAVQDDRLAAAWRVAALTGARRGEIAGLTWRCTDLAGARLSIEQQLLSAPGAPVFGPPKSERSRRTIAIDATTVEALERHLGNQRLERALAGDAYDDHNLLFCDELGGPLQPDYLSYRFKVLRARAGAPPALLHVLRHSCATAMLTAGVPLHIVANRLGDRPETLLTTYAHLLPTSDELAAERIAEVIG